MEKVPTWLDSVKVDFICNNCPNRQIKTISQLSVEQAAIAAEKAATAAAAEPDFGADDLGDDD